MAVRLSKKAARQSELAACKTLGISRAGQSRNLARHLRAISAGAFARDRIAAAQHWAAPKHSAMASNHDDKPRFVEPRRALVKAMSRRAKTSHLGAFQILPEHVLLSCLAQLPREDHDAVADCSTGFRSIMRSERFLKARRAEEITEEALVVVGDCFMALVSGRVWRCLAPMPPAMRLSYEHNDVATGGITVIGSEIFIAGGIRPSGRYSEVSVYDAVDDEWFALPQPPNFPHYTCAVACAGRLFVGIGKCMKAGQVRDSKEPYFQFWDADSQRWVTIPSLPPSMAWPMALERDFDHESCRARGLLRRS